MPSGPERRRPERVDRDLRRVRLYPLEHVAAPEHGQGNLRRPSRACAVQRRGILGLGLILNPFIYPTVDHGRCDLDQPRGGATPTPNNSGYDGQKETGTRYYSMMDGGRRVTGALPAVVIHACRVGARRIQWAGQPPPPDSGHNIPAPGFFIFFIYGYHSIFT